ncbi:MAG: hypothetical protein LKI24_11520 [Acidipropionibacterium sp.]|nr:hypothetical protein [Acidipropionibacterium sp.]
MAAGSLARERARLCTRDIEEPVAAADWAASSSSTRSTASWLICSSAASIPMTRSAGLAAASSGESKPVSAMIALLAGVPIIAEALATPGRSESARLSTMRATES